MLIKQQAHAMIEAKDKVTNASLEIVKNVNNKLTHLSPSDKSKLTTNLLTVLVSSSQVTPTINID